MDELDFKLLDELEIHGLQKMSNLAAKFGVPPRTIFRRLSKMRKERIYQVIAIPNPVSLGYNAWAEIGIKVDPDAIGHVASEIIKHPATYFVSISLGEFDIITDVLFDTFDKLTFFINMELMTIKGVRRSEVMLITYPRKYYALSWPIQMPQKNKTRLDYSANRPSDGLYTIDQIDHKIIKIITKDGQARPESLKSVLGIGETTIRKRMKNLFMSGLFSLVVVPNPEVLQFEAWATIGIIVRQRPTYQVMEQIVQDHRVYAAVMCLGRFNIIIGTRFHNVDLLNSFAKIELPKIEGVDAVHTFLFTRPLKYHGIDWSGKRHQDSMPDHSPTKSLPKHNI